MNNPEPIAWLRALDRSFDERGVVRSSLSPDRTFATPLHTIALQCMEVHTLSNTAYTTFARGLGYIAQAQLEHFPETIFWDMDHLAWSLASTRDLKRMEARIESIARLQEGFGRNSILAFRYGHDFMYGFDWARWVRRDIEIRKHIGPFDLEFLDYLHQRRSELIDLIAENDAKYNQLPQGVARNPFSFSRSLVDEERLHRALAQEGKVPVRAWTREGALSWSEDYREVRKAKAQTLGIQSK